MPKLTIEISDKNYELLKYEAETKGIKHTLLAKNLVENRVQNKTLILMEKLREELNYLLTIARKINNRQKVTQREIDALNEHVAHYCDIKDASGRLIVYRDLKNKTDLLLSWIVEEEEKMKQYFDSKNFTEKFDEDMSERIVNYFFS